MKIATLIFLFLTVLKCEAQISIVNLTMPDSTSHHLRACGNNLIKLNDLPRGAHVAMKNSSIEVTGRFVKIFGPAHDEGDQDTLTIVDGSQMLIGQTIFTYDSCAGDMSVPANRFSKKVFLGGKTNKGTLQKDYCSYVLELTVPEILANPEVIIADSRYKIKRISVNYRLRHQGDINPDIEIPSGSLASQIYVIERMEKGQIIFIDEIVCASVSNPKIVYSLCPFRVIIQ